MQYVDRIAHVQALPQPQWHRRVRVEGESIPFVPRSDGRHEIPKQLGRRRDLGDQPAVGAPELKLAVRLTPDLVALLVDRAMVPATEQREVRERGRAALGPMMEVMALAEPDAAAREATAAVPVVERSP